MNMELPSPMYLGSGGSDSQFGYCSDPSLNGGPSLQEMIDSDMKADFDDVLTGNGISFQGMDSLEMLNDLDTISFLDNGANGLWSTASTPATLAPVSTTTTPSSLHPASYASFSNSYLEDLNGSASVMVNPNNVMPLHHPLQHQQVTSLSVNTNSPASSPQSPMPSPMFQTQQPVYQQPQPRPAKSVRVLPPVSSPMQQVKNFPDSLGIFDVTSWSNSRIFVIFQGDCYSRIQPFIFSIPGAYFGDIYHHKYKQKEKPEESKHKWQRRQRKWVPQTGLFLFLPYRSGIKKQSNWLHVSLGNLQIHVVSWGNILFFKSFITCWGNWQLQGFKSPQ